MSKIICVICKNEKGHDNYIEPSQIGVEVINRKSMERGDKLNVVAGSHVRVNCRKEYIHVWNIGEVVKKKNQSNADRQKTRSSQSSLNFSGNEVTTLEKLTPS